MKTVKEYISEAIVKGKLKQYNKGMSIKFVDLGLPSGTLWGECNLGANKPEEEGEYYAWGELESKNEYSETNYKFYDKHNIWHYTKYNFRIDKLDNLELKDDVAAVNSNNKFVIPSEEQCNELYKKTDLTFIKDYNKTGISGFEFKSKKNKNSIFIPYNEYIDNTKKHNIGIGKCSFVLWTNTVSHTPNTAKTFEGKYREKSSLAREECYANANYDIWKYCGVQIRPVKNK